MTVHLCHARGCHTPVPAKMFMCRLHWRMLPQRLRNRVWAEYVPGQEIRKDPTAAYLAAALEAVAFIAEREAEDVAVQEQLL